MKTLTKAEIIQETIEHIEKHGRAVNDDTCVYLDPDTKRQCAFGRCMDISKYTRDMEGTAANILLYRHSESILKPQYRGHERTFWIDIQYLHDDKLNWDLTDKKEKPFRLSEHGSARVRMLHDRYS